MELSKRLQTIANMVTPGNRTADVGCDHGFVSIYLFEKGISPKVYAMDVRTGPLARAKEHIAEYGYTEYIETRLSDGLTALAPGEAQTIICAGMGGRLMVKILSEGYDRVMAANELILQPQSELAYFRQYLRRNGLKIIKEDMIKEEGKFYPIMKAVPVIGKKKLAGTEEKEEEEQRLLDAFGPCLLKNRHPVLKEYLELVGERNRQILKGIENQGELSEKTKARRAEIIEELEDINKGLFLCGEMK